MSLGLCDKDKISLVNYSSPPSWHVALTSREWACATVSTKSCGATEQAADIRVATRDFMQQHETFRRGITRDGVRSSFDTATFNGQRSVQKRSAKVVDDSRISLQPRFFDFRYPGRQRHVNEPTVLMHSELAGQFEEPFTHSSMSENREANANWNRRVLYRIQSHGSERNERKTSRSRPNVLPDKVIRSKTINQRDKENLISGIQ